MPDARCPMPDARCPMPEGRHPSASGIGHRASGIGHPHPASRIVVRPRIGQISSGPRGRRLKKGMPGSDLPGILLGETIEPGKPRCDEPGPDRRNRRADRRERCGSNPASASWPPGIEPPRFRGAKRASLARTRGARKNWGDASGPAEGPNEGPDESPTPSRRPSITIRRAPRNVNPLRPDISPGSRGVRCYLLRERTCGGNFSAKTAPPVNLPPRSASGNRASDSSRTGRRGSGPSRRRP